MSFSHLDDNGNARMVDVSDKQTVKRIAVASGRIMMAPATIEMLQSQALPKGDPLTTARIAAIQGAKRTADLIPLCHQIALQNVTVDFTVEKDGIIIYAEVTCIDRTGVEMEALTAVSIAALTLYDMCKAVDKNMIIQAVTVEQKMKADHA